MGKFLLGSSLSEIKLAENSPGAINQTTSVLKTTADVEKEQHSGASRLISRGLTRLFTNLHRRDESEIAELITGSVGHLIR